MRHFFLTFLLGSCLTTAAVAQTTFSIKGRVLDRVTGESLPGASVGLNGGAQGAVTDGSGTFSINGVAPGTYQVKASYIGYVALEQTVKVTSQNALVTFRIAEDNNTLAEVNVVAQVAVERETPVAFSSVNEVKLRESLAARDLPMILNETPGVYATQTGGGAGDSRISIRGFDQRNVAVLVNGVPVNDMENGSVYWSNWDLGDVTKNLQVQRGLTASKLALPSVGGLINVQTRGFEARRGGRVRQEIGFNDFDSALPGDLGYFKTSLMLSSGQMKGDWAVTFYGSRRRNNGWVDALYDDAWTYFGTVSKRVGRHQFSLTALGSPQEHGQRSFASQIDVYSRKKAQQAGAIADDNERGFRYNPNWNSLDRYTVEADGDTVHNRQSRVNERLNYYHKPQINFNHYWNASDKLFISNVVYASFGQGGGVGGTGTPSTFATDPKTDRTDLQKIYNANYNSFETLRTIKRPGRPDSLVHETERLSTQYLRSSVNNHRWYGFITSADYKLNEQLTLSAGIDGRYYRGEHYQKVYDLLGGDYTLDGNVLSGPSPRRLTPIGTPNTGNQNADDPYRKLRVGDKMRYNYDGITLWGGGYTQAEYKSGPLAAFLSGTVSQVGYKRIDYYRARKYTLFDGQQIELGAGLTQVPRLDGQGSYYVTRNQTVTVTRDPYHATTIDPSHSTPGDRTRPTGGASDTTLTVGAGSVTNYNGRSYYGVDASGVPNLESKWVKLPGFTVKTGFNYNLTEDNNIFFNIGYLSRPQFFNYVFPGNLGDLAPKLNNENTFSVEMGYAISRQDFKASLNAYNTLWYNRSYTYRAVDDNNNPVDVNLLGLQEVHRGVELDIAQEITRQLSLNAAFSIGDWRWNSAGTYYVYDQDGVQTGTGTFNPKGVHVGNAAQNQFMLGVRYEPFTGLYVRPTFTLFSKLYSDFDPSSVSGDKPQDAYRLPTTRNIDLHTGYGREVPLAGHPYRISFTASVLNVLNEFYITDAPFRAGAGIDPFNPSTIEVYFNRGRTLTMGLSVDF